MSWNVPSYKLDPDQKNFLQRVRCGPGKNAWLRGFAGSGKSVLLVHTLEQYIEKSHSSSACIVLYTQSLIDLFRSGMLSEKTRHVPVMTFHNFRRNPRPYDLILVDEVQDLPEEDVLLLRNTAKRLYVAGDEEQSIYDNGVDPSQIATLIDGESYQLTVLHRLTGHVIEIAKILFPDKQLHKAKQQRAILVDVTLARAEEADDEVEYIWRQASQNAQPGYPVAILVPRREQAIRFANAALALEGADPWLSTENRWGKPDFGAMNTHLNAAGLSLRYIGNGYGSLAETHRQGRVVIMTYHSAKGLDFETVFIPYLNSQTHIWRDDDRLSNALFYVALTRSRRNLTLSYTGEPHRYIRNVPDRLLHKISLPLNGLGPSAEVVADPDEIIF